MKTKQQIFEFIDKQKTAFIASVDDEGYPNLKAMFNARKREGYDFYFSTNTSSLRVKQYGVNPKASIYYYGRTRFSCEGVMLVGTMEVLEDEQIKKELWSVGDIMYYPKGVTDPDYCILKFTAKKARHYYNLEKQSFELN